MGEISGPPFLPGPDEHRQPPPGTSQPWENADHAQAVKEGALAPGPPALPVCLECGLTRDRYPTYYGAHVLLEPGMPVPAHMVPAWHRWYIDGSGQTWNSGTDEPAPGAVCRLPHRLACPGIPPEEIGLWGWLDELRGENAIRARRKADEDGFPSELPDAG